MSLQKDWLSCGGGGPGMDELSAAQKEGVLEGGRAEPGPVESSVL